MDNGYFLIGRAKADPFTLFVAFVFLPLYKFLLVFHSRATRYVM